MIALNLVYLSNLAKFYFIFYSAVNMIVERLKLEKLWNLHNRQIYKLRPWGLLKIFLNQIMNGIKSTADL